MAITRAISIKQPFVELILQGKKKLEFRSRATKIRERVYLYASLKPRTEASLWKKANKAMGEVPMGLIVGSIEITSCAWDKKNNNYAYKLSKPKRFKKPLKAKNRPSPVFWLPRF